MIVKNSEELAFSVAQFVGSEGALETYYMYHGGTNFGYSARGPLITNSYDYDDSTDEYMVS